MITRTRKELQAHVRMSFDRRALAQRAMVASLQARTCVGRDLEHPICVYALADAHGLTVRFNDINMDGMYDRVPTPRIHLSALRPLGRRAFNCAHELGHHLLAHGSTIDELREEAAGQRFTDPNEFLADVFAGFVLMPTLGLRHAFNARGCQAETATPQQMFAIACNFGVGYSTLVNHLAYSLHEVSPSRADALLRKSPKEIRSEILGDATTEPLIVADEQWNSPTLDAEVGTQLLFPPGSHAGSDLMSLERDFTHGRLFRATRPGIARVHRRGTSWAVFVRVSRFEYVGLARYRHLEDPPDE